MMANCKFSFLSFLFFCIALTQCNSRNVNADSKTLSGEVDVLEIKNGQCGGTIELDSGTLIYPGEGSVNPGELCIWTIHLREMDGFRMNFTNMDLPGQNLQCTEAAVTIYGMTNLIPSDDPERYRFCNENNNDGYHYLTGNVATVVFYTSLDFSGNGEPTGFALHWEGSRFQPVPTMHSSTYTSSQTGVVWYPVDGEYAPNAALTWLVHAGGPENASLVDIAVNSVDFESCNLADKCLCDALIIYQISDIGDMHEVQRFCGAAGGNYINDVSSNFVVAFYSDSLDVPDSGFGFQLTWRPPTSTPPTEGTTENPPITSEGTTTTRTTTTENPSEGTTVTTTTTEGPGGPGRTCGGILEGTHGVIEYKYQEGELYNNLDRCIWTIRTFPAYKHISFYKYETQFEASDWITVFGFTYLNAGSGGDHGLNSTHQLGKVNGPEAIDVDGNVAIVMFTSDASNVRQGFRLSWEVYGFLEPVLSWTDVNTGNSSGTYDYPGYSNLELSTFVFSDNYRFNHDNSPQLQLTLNWWSFETSSSCGYDGLIVYSVQRDSLRQLGRFCGIQMEPHEPFLSPDAFILVLYSDYSNVYYGFGLEYQLTDSKLPNLN